jgi:hypothetical protein
MLKRIRLLYGSGVWTLGRSYVEDAANLIIMSNQLLAFQKCRVEGAPYGTPTPTEPIVQFYHQLRFIFKFLRSIIS